MLWLTVVVGLAVALLLKYRETGQVRYDAVLLAEETLYVSPQADGRAARVIYDLQVK